MDTQKTVKIEGKVIPVLTNNRALVEFERMMGKSSAQIDTYEDAIALVYCSLKSGARSAGIPFKMDFEAFIDYTDEHPEVMVKDEDIEAGENADGEKKNL